MAASGNPPIDPKMVALEVQKGKSLEEIQRIFGIKMKSQVHVLYVRGLRQLGEIPQSDLPQAKGETVCQTPRYRVYKEYRPKGQHYPDPLDPYRKTGLPKG